MAGPLPDLEPEGCLELCFARETAKLAYRGAEEGHEADPVFAGYSERPACLTDCSRACMCNETS
eukprot:8278661-Alexandrium_andersonii.AAC.1